MMARHGCFEFMGERTHELFTLARGKHQRVHIFLHGLGHGVEAFGHAAYLVLRGHLGAGGVVAARNAPRGAVQFIQRARHALCQQHNSQRTHAEGACLHAPEAGKLPVARGKHARHIAQRAQAVAFVRGRDGAL